MFFSDERATPARFADVNVVAHFAGAENPYAFTA
jgi:hypothetical protein